MPPEAAMAREARSCTSSNKLDRYWNLSRKLHIRSPSSPKCGPVSSVSVGMSSNVSRLIRSIHSSAFGRMRLTEAKRTSRTAATLAKYALWNSSWASLSSAGMPTLSPLAALIIGTLALESMNLNPTAPSTVASMNRPCMKWYAHCMSAELPFMPAVYRIAEAAMRLDVQKARDFTVFLAFKLEEAGEEGAAQRLRRILEDSDRDRHPLSASAAQAVPVDGESRFPLLEKVRLGETQEPAMVLDDAQLLTVQEYLSIAKSHAQLEAAGLPSSASMLLHGPPGCGKSRVARYIARDLGRDLYVAHLDGLISPDLGSTSKHIRALIEFASRTPCVLFLDEFDVIARLRADTQVPSELKRVLNTFIQNLDSLGARSVVVAATNHEALLDKAVWGQFEFKIQLNYPGAELRGRLWAEFLGELDFSPNQLAALVDLSDGFSGLEIRDVCNRLRRRCVIQGVAPQFQDLFPALQRAATGQGETRRFVGGLDASDLRGVVAALRNRDPSLYRHRLLAELIGVSSATTHRWMKERLDG